MIAAMYPRNLLWASLAAVAMLGHGQLLMGADPTNDPAGTAPAGPSKEAIERPGAGAGEEEGAEIF